MLPVVIAAAEHQPLLGPDDLASGWRSRRRRGSRRPWWRAARRARHRRRRRGTAPRPRASRRGRRSAPCRCAWSPRGPSLVAPGRIVVHAVGRSVTIRCGRTPSSSRATSAASVLSPQSRRCCRAARDRPGGETGTAGGSGVSSSRGSGASPLSSASSSPSSKPRLPRSKPRSCRSPSSSASSSRVPAGVERELVVGEDVGALLRLGEVGEFDHRHVGQPELARRQHPAVAGDDAVLAVDEDRVGPAELPDRAGDLRDLRVGVGAGVAGVGDQRGERALLDREVGAGGLLIQHVAMLPRPVAGGL